jgi:predicted metal-dependent hydrolase
LDRRTKKELLGRLEQDALRICARFRLEYRVLEAERANVKRRYGVCYSDGTIKIRLRHASSGKPLKYSSLINTLCHELAHLVHFNHGLKFQALYAEILEWARRERIYRPGPLKRLVDKAALVVSAPTVQSAPLLDLALDRVETSSKRGTKRRPQPERPGRSSQLELFG